MFSAYSRASQAFVVGGRAMFMPCYPAIAIRDHSVLKALAHAEMVVGRDVTSGYEAFMYLDPALEGRIAAGGPSAAVRGTMLTFVFTHGSDDFKALVAAVVALKGSCEYAQPA